MTYSALFCSVVNKNLCLTPLQYEVSTLTRAQRGNTRTQHHAAFTSSTMEWMELVEAGSYIHSFTFLHTQDFLGAFFGSAPSSWLFGDVGACFSERIFYTSSVSWLSRKRPMLGFFLDGEILGESFLFLVILLGDHDALQVLG